MRRSQSPDQPYLNQRLILSHISQSVSYSEYKKASIEHPKNLKHWRLCFFPHSARVSESPRSFPHSLLSTSPNSFISLSIADSTRQLVVGQLFLLPFSLTRLFSIETFWFFKSLLIQGNNLFVLSLYWACLGFPLFCFDQNQFFDLFVGIVFCLGFI